MIEQKTENNRYNIMRIWLVFPGAKIMFFINGIHNEVHGSIY